MNKLAGLTIKTDGTVEGTTITCDDGEKLKCVAICGHMDWGVYDAAIYLTLMTAPVESIETEHGLRLYPNLVPPEKPKREGITICSPPMRKEER